MSEDPVTDDALVQLCRELGWTAARAHGYAAMLGSEGRTDPSLCRDLEALALTMRAVTKDLEIAVFAIVSSRAGQTNPPT